MVTTQMDYESIAITAGTLSIDPSWPVVLGGSKSQDPHTAIEDPIEANILLIRSTRIPVVLVAMDVLYVGPEMRSRLVTQLTRTLGECRLICFASHTHAAPATDPTKPKLGEPDPEYVTQVVSRIVERVRGMWSEAPTECRAVVFSGSSRAGVSRRVLRPVLVGRRIRFFRTVSGTAHHRWTDESLPIVRFEDASSGEPIAILWNFSCHPVGHPHPRHVSSHFPGIVRARIRGEQGHDDLPVLFLQGFSGDCRPRDPEGASRATRKGWRRYLQDPGYGDFTEASYQSWTTALAETVIDCMRGEGLVARRRSSIEFAEVEVPRERIVKGALAQGPVRVVGLRIGQDIAIVGISGEVVGTYAKRLRSEVKMRALLLAGCLDDVVGYLPTRMMLRTGGYESEGFCESLSLSGVNENVESELREALRAVVAGLGLAGVASPRGRGIRHVLRS